MITLYLIFTGFMLMGDQFTAVGLIAMLVGIFASLSTKRACIICGIILLCAFPGWETAGMTGIAVGLIFS